MNGKGIFLSPSAFACSTSNSNSYQQLIRRIRRTDGNSSRQCISMASRPDYLKRYEAQSFPVQARNDLPFLPPADYPTDELMSRPRKPRTPPSDYPVNAKYPFSNFAGSPVARHPSEVVRTTAEAAGLPVQPDYPAPMINKQPATKLYRRHTTSPRSQSPVVPVRKTSVNKAFLHHIKNFDKFSTIKGRNACCAGCPICKAIEAANIALAGDDSPENTPTLDRGAKKVEPNGQRWKSNSGDFQDDEDDAEAYQKERRQRAFLRDLTRREAKVARVVADRVSRHVRELTVTKGEYLEILDDSRKWHACSNVSGQLGYVPSSILVAVSFEEVALHRKY